MVPLLSGRKHVRVGSGPMNSAFYTSSHSEFNKQILHPAFVKLKIVQRMKGCATRVLRAYEPRVLRASLHPVLPPFFLHVAS